MTAEIFNKIRNTKGTKAKVAVLAAGLSDEKHGDDLYRQLCLASDPFITFGIANTKKIQAEYDKAKDSSFTSPLNADSYELLLDLSTRALSGNAARDGVIRHLIDHKIAPEHAEVLLGIIKKDLRINMGTTLINQAVENFDDLTPIYVYNCQLAHPFEDARMDPNQKYVADYKRDGIRCQVWLTKNSDNISFLSRNGLPITSPDENLIAEVLKFKSSVVFEDFNSDEDVIILDSEIEKIGNQFNDTSSAVRKKEQQEELCLTVFDILTLDEFNGKGRVPFIQRRARYKAQSITPLVVMSDLYPVANPDEVREVYNRARDLGLEGAIVKTEGYIYSPTRSWDWMKVKGKDTEDLPIEDIEPGTGKYEGMIGAYIVRRANGVLVNVGSGLSDADRQADPASVIGQILEVEFHEETPDGSLRHPRAVKFRKDKQ